MDASKFPLELRGCRDRLNLPPARDIKFSIKYLGGRALQRKKFRKCEEEESAKQRLVRDSIQTRFHQLLLKFPATANHPPNPISLSCTNPSTQLLPIRRPHLNETFCLWGTEAATCLSCLLRCPRARADTLLLEVGAAPASAVGVISAFSADELCPRLADVPCACGVKGESGRGGGEGKDGGEDGDGLHSGSFVTKGCLNSAVTSDI